MEQIAFSIDRYLWLFGVCLLLPLMGMAQYEAKEYWTMDQPESLQRVFRPSDQEPQLKPGLYEQALYLDGQKNSLNFSSFLRMGEGYALSFWFKPEQWYGKQSVFRQSRVTAGAESEVGRFIEVFLSDRIGVLQTEKNASNGQLAHLDIVSEPDEGWLFFTFTGDEFGYEVYLQGRKVAESQDGTMFRDLSNFHNALVVGAGPTYFRGLIDEVKIFNERIDAYAIQKMLEGYREKRETKAVVATSEKPTTAVVEPEDEPIITASGTDPVEENPVSPTPSTPSPEPTSKVDLPESLTQQEFRGREIVIDPVVARVDTRKIKVKIWDSYRKIDRDQVSIYLNDESNKVFQKLELPKKKRAATATLKLSDADEQVLIFYADFTGDFYSVATIAIQIEGQDHVYNLAASKDQNAAIRIIPSKQEPKREESLSNLVIEGPQATLELIRSGQAEDYVRCQVEVEGVDYPYEVTLSEDTKRIPVFLEPGESKLVRIQGDDSKFQSKDNQQVRFRVKESTNLLTKYGLELHESNYQFRITRQAAPPPPPSVELVTTGERQIKMEEPIDRLILDISDHDKPDKDRITIMYNGKAIVDREELKKEAFQIHVDLDTQLSSHRFLVKADSYGTSTEPVNTPRIRVLVDGEEWDNFALELRKSQKNGTAIIEVSAAAGEN